SAKLLLPVYAVLQTVLAEQLSGQALYVASGLLFVVVVGAMPGVCGFLVWELKESWRLYAANRPATLRPVLIGEHGQRMARALRPGFHAGTVPKLYRKWRQAERRGRAAAARHCRAGLRHVEEELHCFLERELVRLLRDPPGSREVGLNVGAIHLSVW